MDLSRLQTAIEKDLAEGRYPLMVIATAGATGTGSIDLLTETSSLARRYACWFHVDAAWAGGGILSDTDFYDTLIRTGESWISMLQLPQGMVLRACITSIHSTEQNIDTLVRNLEQALPPSITSVKKSK